MPPHFIELSNRVLDRFTAEERSRTGIHACPGGDRDSVHSADADDHDVLPGRRVYLRDDANGVPQFAIST